MPEGAEGAEGAGMDVDGNSSEDEAWGEAAVTADVKGGTQGRVSASRMRASPRLLV